MGEGGASPNDAVSAQQYADAALKRQEVNLENERYFAHLTRRTTWTQGKGSGGGAMLDVNAPVSPGGEGSDDGPVVKEEEEEEEEDVKMSRKGGSTKRKSSRRE